VTPAGLLGGQVPDKGFDAAAFRVMELTDMKDAHV
jgi:hypothetical protein